MGRGGLRRGKPLTFEGFGLLTDELPRPVTSASLFGNDRPLELEIGSGTGTFLLKEAERRPEVNFLGIEYTKRYFRLAADRLRRHEADNARVVDAEAERFLLDFLAEETLSAVHVYFPDPWPKRRHHPRRFVQPDRVARLASRMRRGALLRIVSDHAEYFRHIEKVIESSLLVRVDFVPLCDPDSGELVGTNFEKKYLREGRPFYALAAERP